MNFAVLRASLESDRESWQNFWSRLPDGRRDVYFLPEYLLASEREGRGEAACAVAWSGEALWLYPFLIAPIPGAVAADGKPLCDLVSPYGYGGPVVTRDGEATSFLSAAGTAFSEWAGTQRIVAEFTRFHPLLENGRWAPAGTRVIVDRTTVPIDLAVYPSAWLHDPYYRVHRGMVRRAEREGFVFEVAMQPLPAMGWFTTLYNETQDALQASDETRFSQNYFDSLVSGLGERAWLGMVRKDGLVAAAVLVLEGDSNAHCHLMGYRRLTKTAGMTNLVYHGIALEASRRGRSLLHMGGGRTAAEDDTLLKFKRSLSPASATFAIGKRCHDQPTYDRLAREWEERHGARPPGYFLFYRLPGTVHSTTIASSSS
jgi:hypothetical protein